MTNGSPIRASRRRWWANHALALGTALGITFPFDFSLGIPIYHALAQWLHG